jgi:hypothetical protein
MPVPGKMLRAPAHEYSPEKATEDVVGRAPPADHNHPGRDYECVTVTSSMTTSP